MRDKSALTELSRYLSLVLRHQPEHIGLSLNMQGWENVQELLEKSAAVGLTQELLEEIVRSGDKQRFAFSPDQQEIQANQGRRIKVDLALLPQQPPVCLYHGTARRHRDAIRSQSLLKQQRQHVHLSEDRPTALAVGRRYAPEPPLLRIATAEMAPAGFVFYRSAHGVWLTEAVPPAYLQALEHSHD